MLVQLDHRGAVPPPEQRDVLGDGELRLGGSDDIVPDRETLGHVAQLRHDGEAEIEAINASEVVVDELDLARGKKAPAKDEDIPDIDIGEAENPTLEHERTPEHERRVMVERDAADEGFHGEEPADLPEEERVKHAQFEAARKKHYEMKNVKDLLGYVWLYVIVSFAILTQMIVILRSYRDLDRRLMLPDRPFETDIATA